MWGNKRSRRPEPTFGLYSTRCLFHPQVDPKFLKNMRFAKKHNVNLNQQKKRAAARLAKYEGVPKPVKL